MSILLKKILIAIESITKEVISMIGRFKNITSYKKNRDMPIYNVVDIVYFVLNKLYHLSLYNSAYAPSNMKLQKLLYFIQGCYMRNNNGRELFEDDFQAWVSGPVIPSVYGMFRFYGRGIINKREIKRIPSLSQAAIIVITEVVEELGKEDSFVLSKMTHDSQTAWSIIREKYNLKQYEYSREIIPKSMIHEEFLNYIHD